MTENKGGVSSSNGLHFGRHRPQLKRDHRALVIKCFISLRLGDLRIVAHIAQWRSQWRVLASIVIIRV